MSAAIKPTKLPNSGFGLWPRINFPYSQIQKQRIDKKVTRIGIWKLRRVTQSRIRNIITPIKNSLKIPGKLTTAQFAQVRLTV